MKLGQFTAGYILSVGIAATVFILALKYVGGRWNVPLVSPVAKAI
jgi:hypothetical protein